MNFTGHSHYAWFQHQGNWTQRLTSVPVWQYLDAHRGRKTSQLNPDVLSIAQCFLHLLVFLPLVFENNILKRPHSSPPKRKTLPHVRFRQKVPQDENIKQAKPYHTHIFIYDIYWETSRRQISGKDKKNHQNKFSYFSI